MINKGQRLLYWVLVADGGRKCTSARLRTGLPKCIMCGPPPMHHQAPPCFSATARALPCASLTLRASAAPSNSSWQVLSSTRLKVMGRSSPSCACKEGGGRSAGAFTTASQAQPAVQQAHAAAAAVPQSSARQAANNI